MLKGSVVSLNIALVSEFFPPFVTGGAEIFLDKLGKYLETKGHKIIVITTEQDRSARSSGFKTYKIRSSPIRFSYRYQFHGITLPWMFCNKRLVDKLERIYDKEKIDIVYINNLFHLSFAPMQAASRKELPTLLDVHDYWPVCFTKDKYYCMDTKCTSEKAGQCAWCVGKHLGHGLFGLPLFIPLTVEKYLRYKELENISGVVCHSDYVAKELKRRGFMAKVIPYPTFTKTGQRKRVDNKFRVLFVGRLEKRKGADLILQLAEKIKEGIDGKEVRIDVVGKGPLKKILDRPDLGIIVHGHLGEERFKLFRNADILLVPSRWPEPFGIVVLEAMAFGLPVVAFGGGGLGELVKQTGAGVVTNEKHLVEFVKKIAKNRRLRTAITSNQRRSLKDFQPNRIFNTYEKIFKNIAAGRN
jgi:glycosyltransferase involved in cell wall biosynthesis